MVILVQQLKGELRVEGLQKDLEIGIEHCKKIIPYLHSVKDPTEREDLLIKLALEAGDFCALAIKICSREIVYETVVPNTIPMDYFESIEHRFRCALQFERKNITESTYRELTKKFPDVAMRDEHIFDLYDPLFKLGFYPIDQKLDSLLSIIYWEMYNKTRISMMNKYQHRLDDVVKVVGRQYCVEYIRGVLADQLTESQLTEVMDSWGEQRTDKDFTRLLFVMMGVLSPQTQIAVS